MGALIVNTKQKKEKKMEKKNENKKKYTVKLQ